MYVPGLLLRSRGRRGRAAGSELGHATMPIPTRLPKWFDPRLHGGASRIHGRGLFVRAPVRAGEILMRWGGVLLAVADYDPVLYRPASTTHYDEGRCLATPAGEPASLDELLNHACDPNLWLIDEVTVVARRDRRRGRGDGGLCDVGGQRARPHVGLRVRIRPLPPPDHRPRLSHPRAPGALPRALPAVPRPRDRGAPRGRRRERRVRVRPRAARAARRGPTRRPSERTRERA